MELPDYISTVRRHWLLIAVLGIIGAVIGFGLAANSPKMYKSTSSVFVSTQQGATTSELVQGSTFAQNLIQSYAQLATMPSVLNPVITKLDLQTTPVSLAKSVSVDTPLNTVLINITVTNSNPVKAAQIADEVSSSLASTVQRLSPPTSKNSPSITVQQVAVAQPANYPFAPNTKFSVATGMLGGLVVGLIAAFALQLLETRIRVESDLRRVTKLPLIGQLSERHRKTGNGFIFRSAPESSDAEEFRRLAANLQFLNPDSPVKSAVVTSALPSEGKTTLAINLALALSERLEKVLVVDADLRRPNVASSCGIEGAVGLTTVLAGSAKLADVIEHWGGIDILPAGMVPPNSSQLIASDSMATLLKSLIAEYDMVIVDSAPLLPVSDSLPLTRITDGAVFVTRFNSTRRSQVAQALESVEAVGGTVVGIAINRVKRSRVQKKYGYASNSVEVVPPVGDTTSGKDKGSTSSKVNGAAQSGEKSKAQSKPQASVGVKSKA